MHADLSMENPAPKLPLINSAPAFAKLPLHFEPSRLLGDLDCIPESSWVNHFNEGYYEGTWSAVALRSPGGAESRIYPDPAREEDFRDSQLLTKCSYIQEVIATFECPKTSIRLMKLGPNSKIREHTDLNLAYEDREVRLHIPITTNSETDFYVDNRQIPMRVGECWYVNVNFPHRVTNNGQTARIHLVIDCVVDDWLEEVFCGMGFPRLTQSANIADDITEQNIERVIEELRRQDTETTKNLADELMRRK
jgi:hypothetical protein